MLSKIIVSAAIFVLSFPCFSSVNNDEGKPLLDDFGGDGLELRAMVAMEENPLVVHKDLIGKFVESTLIGFSADEAKSCLGLDTVEGYRRFVAQHGDLQTLMDNESFQGIFDRNYSIERDYILSREPDITLSFEYNSKDKGTMRYFRPNTLKVYPQQICRLRELSSLIIMNTSIVALPTSLSELVYLEKFVLNGSALKSFPMVCLSLTTLKSLSLSNNAVSVLPQEIADLKNLVELDISGTKMGDLPTQMRVMTSLRRLIMVGMALSNFPKVILTIPHLSELDLSNNKLECLPDGIAALSHLEVLSLSQNQLSILTPTVCDLASLKILRLDYNWMLTLPPQICQLKLLTKLGLENNCLKELPIELTFLSRDIVTHHYHSEPEFLGSNPNLKLPPQFERWIMSQNEKESLNVKNEATLEEVKRIKAAREKAKKIADRSKKH
jgi:hypothetical protein